MSLFSNKNPLGKSSKTSWAFLLDYQPMCICELWVYWQMLRLKFSLLNRNTATFECWMVNFLIDYKLFSLFHKHIIGGQDFFCVKFFSFLSNAWPMFLLFRKFILNVFLADLEGQVGNARIPESGSSIAAQGTV